MKSEMQRAWSSSEGIKMPFWGKCENPIFKKVNFERLKKFLGGWLFFLKFLMPILELRNPIKFFSESLEPFFGLARFRISPMRGDSTLCFKMHFRRSEAESGI